MAFSLAFSQAPPDHPFVGVLPRATHAHRWGSYEIHGGIELPLSLELYYEEKDKQVSKGVFEVEGSEESKDHEERRALLNYTSLSDGV